MGRREEENQSETEVTEERIEMKRMEIEKQMATESDRAAGRTRRTGERVNTRKEAINMHPANASSTPLCCREMFLMGL